MHSLYAIRENNAQKFSSSRTQKWNFSSIQKSNTKFQIMWLCLLSFLWALLKYEKDAMTLTLENQNILQGCQWKKQKIHRKLISLKKSVLFYSTHNFRLIPTVHGYVHNLIHNYETTCFRLPSQTQTCSLFPLSFCASKIRHWA